jgi:hypothetical protein
VTLMQLIVNVFHCLVTKKIVILKSETDSLIPTEYGNGVMGARQFELKSNRALCIKERRLQQVIHF